ncbi:SURF1 family protein [Primorskyibacter aestuariivivens]|uniref:SURF1 family protein n=1 Tax=Primorskyibacter aestuariivivens TaxID=1888912 RepID=UPI0022FFEC77|nr:SURF1 family protein [Primorskyibacter aestuariivivens]MDA7427322.1 SURF1 family protein [Primorskyibacter aestuariivivens]
MNRLFFALIIGLTGVCILLWLGFWQVDRLAWKEGVLAEIEARIAADPVALPETPEEERDKYLPVAVTGEIGEGELYVLVSRKQVGAGYRVIAPLETDTGRRILLDRGFIKTDKRAAARPTGAAKITGNLHWPDDRNSSTPDNDEAGNIWFARDIEDMARVLRTEPTLVIARQTSLADTGVTPLPVDTSAIPNDHLNYAITWFSLALIWASMTGFFIWRTTRQKDA